MKIIKNVFIVSAVMISQAIAAPKIQIIKNQPNDRETEDCPEKIEDSTDDTSFQRWFKYEKPPILGLVEKVLSEQKLEFKGYFKKDGISSNKSCLWAGKEISVVSEFCFEKKNPGEPGISSYILIPHDLKEVVTLRVDGLSPIVKESEINVSFISDQYRQSNINKVERLSAPETNRFLNTVSSSHIFEEKFPKCSLVVKEFVVGDEPAIRLCGCRSPGTTNPYLANWLNDLDKDYKYGTELYSRLYDYMNQQAQPDQP